MRSGRTLPPLKPRTKDAELSIAIKQQSLYQLFKSVELEYHCHFLSHLTRRAKQLRLRGLNISIDDAREQFRLAEDRFETRLAREFVKVQEIMLQVVEGKQGETYERLRKECEHLKKTYSTPGKCSDSLSDLSQLSSGSSRSHKLSRSTTSTPLKPTRSASRCSFVA